MDQKSLNLASIVQKLDLKEDVGVLEEAFLETNNEELTVFKELLELSHS